MIVDYVNLDQITEDLELLSDNISTSVLSILFVKPNTYKMNKISITKMFTFSANLISS